MSSAGRTLLIAPIRFYQRAISPALPATCRFYPTCSTYALESIQVHGAVKGTGFAIWRLLKCGPWHRGGIDHVRPRRTTSPDQQRDNGES